MITKPESESCSTCEPFEQSPDASEKLMPVQRGLGGVLSDVDGDCPPDYDDPNYIASPTSFSVSSSGASAVPLFVLHHPLQDDPTGASETGMTSPSGSPTTDPNSIESENERERTRALGELERNMSALQEARRRGAQQTQQTQRRRVDVDAREVVRLEELVFENMCHLAVLQPDSQSRAEWRARAEVFMRTMSSFRHPFGSGSEGSESSSPPSESDEARSNANASVIKNAEPIGITDPPKGISISKPPSFSFGKRAKRLLDKAKDDKCLSLIAKGTAGVAILNCAAPFLIVYGAACVVYGAGKCIVYLHGKALKKATHQQVQHHERLSSSLPSPLLNTKERTEPGEWMGMGDLKRKKRLALSEGRDTC